MRTSDEIILCPRCVSPRAQNLSQAVRHWFCCGACGHIWPRDASPEPPIGDGSDLPR